MDEKRLAEIEERAAKATPGPWYRDEQWSDVVQTPGGHIELFSANDYDAEFIAAARQDVPDLLVEVRDLGREIDACHAIMKHWIAMRNRIMKLSADDDTLSSRAIEEVEAEVKRLREALSDIAHGPVGFWNLPEHREKVIRDFMKIATEALNG